HPLLSVEFLRDLFLIDRPAFPDSLSLTGAEHIIVGKVALTDSYDGTERLCQVGFNGFAVNLKHCLCAIVRRVHDRPTAQEFLLLAPFGLDQFADFERRLGDASLLADRKRSGNGIEFDGKLFVALAYNLSVSGHGHLLRHSTDG